MATTKLSRFAPDESVALPEIQGVRLAACEAGIRYKNRTDLLLAVLEPGTTVAGVLTRSKAPSAPVDWCRRHLERGRARALVVNSGNANAFTGAKGDESVDTIARLAAKAVGCEPEDVFLASTGVIGEPLATAPFAAHLDSLAVAASGDAWQAAAKAIMTTDTFAKTASRTVELAGGTATINGIAKGSGMIAPDMATMLAFVFSDVAIAPAVLRDLLCEANRTTFNAVTVDGDTSTSDTLLAFATGKAAARGLAPIADRTSEAGAAFAEALHGVLHDLAVLVAKDGEGLSKFVTVRVTGAENDNAARTIAMAIANSPLVKTAIAGEDPNWGRIVMAVGKSGEAADRDRLEIRFGDLLVAQDGAVAADYQEAAGAAYMKRDELEITVDVGVGEGVFTAYTCDLTHDYIAINADYRS